jgi:hypothetical protein
MNAILQLSIFVAFRMEVIGLLIGLPARSRAKQIKVLDAKLFQVGFMSPQSA